MMARTKRSRRSYSAGEWGRNRVRVFADPKTGLYQIEWRDNGRRLRWKTAKTVLQCYQRPDEGQLRKALEARRRALG